MYIIADSGSSKTDWFLIDGLKIVDKQQTQGLNPYFVNAQQIESILKSTLQFNCDINGLEKIYFYGAGCSSENKNNEIKTALTNYFSVENIYVSHDLLAAARALCGIYPGIACILGTGSNSCVYDGDKIVDNITSLGYMFGDEGSGAVIGKNLIQKYLKKEFPNELKDAFDEVYKTTTEEILTNVYKKEFPNRYLATYSLFCKTFVEHEFIRTILDNAFDDFIKNQILVYKEHKNLPICITGSVGFAFKELISMNAEKYGIEIYKAVKSPMYGLIEYHSKLKP